MDNMRDFTTETRVKRGRGILVVTAILLVLATLAVMLCVSMSAASIKIAVNEMGPEALALIALLPGMLIFGFAGAVISVITSVLARKIRKRYLGAEQKFGGVSLAISLIYIATSVILPIVTIILLQQ